MFDLDGQALATGRRVLDGLLVGPMPAPEPAIRQALAPALLMPNAALTVEQREWLDVLRA